MKVHHLRILGFVIAATLASAAGQQSAQAASFEDPAKPIVPEVLATDKAADRDEKAKQEQPATANQNVSDPVVVYLDPQSTKAVGAAKSVRRDELEVTKARGFGKPVNEAAGGALNKAIRASRFAPLISKYAKELGVPVTLAGAVVRVESNFDPGARGSAGEIGLMQIKPATARGMGYSGSTKGLYDPATNLHWGMKYLAGAHKLAGGDTCGTILRYNGGHYAKRMNPVSARYCRKVQALLKSGEAKAYVSL